MSEKEPSLLLCLMNKKKKDKNCQVAMKTHGVIMNKGIVSEMT